MRDGFPELQQTAEGERGHVRLPPAVGLFLHVLLKLDPSGRLLPLHLLVLVHRQLVQLHKHLQAAEHGGTLSFRRDADEVNAIHANSCMQLQPPAESLSDVHSNSLGDKLHASLGTK